MEQDEEVRISTKPSVYIKEKDGLVSRSTRTEGLLEFVGLSFVYVSVLKSRHVQIGLIVAFLIQLVGSAVVTIYFRPWFLDLAMKIIESEGSLPPEEAVEAVLTIMLFATSLLGTLLLSGGFVGFMCGKVSSRLRYGVVMGIVSILLSLVASSITSFFYGPPLSSIYQTLLNLGFMGKSTLVDSIVAQTRTCLGLFALGGGGGAIGQILGLRFGGKVKE